jgi:HlyD family secretion protein
MKKWVLILAFLVVCAGAVSVWYFTKDKGPEQIEVQTEQVARMEIVQTVTATGRIQPKKQVNISADVSAKITGLYVEEGDWVEKGTLLVELDHARYLAAEESAEASLRVAQANSNVTKENKVKAEKDHVRSRDLAKAGLETQARLDAAEAVLAAESARFQASLDQVEQARAYLRQAKDDRSKTRIFAPRSGTISLLNKEVGEIALGSQFQEDVIMVVSNLAGMEAEVKVDENDIVLVSIGDEAVIEVDALPDVVLSGEVTEIANTASVTGTGTTDQKTEFIVKIAITDPHSQLRPGMTATADIVTEVREDALGVPIQAVAVRTEEQVKEWSENGADEAWEADKDGFVELVFLLQDETVKAVQVSTGIQSDNHIEIADGLEEGAEIVTGNYRVISRDLSDGARVVRSGDSEPVAAESD